MILNIYNKMNILHNDPEIYTIDNFISPKDCSHIINIAKDKIQPALVSGDREGYISNGRSGQNCWLEHDYDKIIHKICKKIAKRLDMPLANAEKMQVIYYAKDQEYRNHYDGWLFDNSEKSRRNMKWGGQRLVTALGYLSEVESGGGTRFTKLDTLVKAETGKLLVFSNVLTNSNKRHDLSEHAGQPVLEGEKWAFNLWFRETSTKIEYLYPINMDNSVKDVQELIDLTDVHDVNDVKDVNDVNDVNDVKDAIVETRVNISNNIIEIENLLDDVDIDNILSLTEFSNNNNRSSVWINNSKIPNIISIISRLINIDSSYFENVCITRYLNNLQHKDYLDAYDLNSDNGKKNTKDLGQRISTLSVFFSPIAINFPKLNRHYLGAKGSGLYYCNCFNNTNIRDPDMIKSYSGLQVSETITTREMYILNIYIREKSRVKPEILAINNINNINNINSETDENREYKIQEIPEDRQDRRIVDYDEIIKDIYEKPLQHNLTIADFKMVNKALKPYVIETLDKIHTLKTDSLFLNPENLDQEKTYFIDEYNPVVVENVVNPAIHKIVDEYFKVNIKNGAYQLGDRQANRYKVMDEIVTRLLHLEFLPLIEKIVGRKMEATYTYLSAYLKGTDLPAHTDREECEFTCSYIIGKPLDCNWNIYVHKVKQPEKHKGRYDFTPEKNECLAIDCNENGLMIFNGTDHIHFREILKHDYYNVVLLHYRTL